MFSYATHCALRFSHLPIMLLTANMVVMRFPATTNYVMSLLSPVRELIEVAIKFCLSMDTSGVPCVEIALDPLGYHAASCKQGGGDAVIRHNQLRDLFTEACCPFSSED